MTVLRISELFASLQGEGVSAGTPATFLRLGDCNLNCSYCDTPYSWDWRQYDRKTELTDEDLLVTAARIRALTPRRLVITGGEPLLQQPALEELVTELSEFATEVETNGTITPSTALSNRITQWNVSPKLASSGVPEAHRVKMAALATLRDTGRAWLKWVVVSEADLEEILRVVASLGWPTERVILMPEARSQSQLVERSPLVAEAAMQHGFRFSTRLHVLLWGNQRGK